MATERGLYLRNRRPNIVVIKDPTTGGRIALQHRGHRQDSVALSIDALQDSTISRWINEGRLEKITKEAYTKLAARKVDTLPNDYLQRAAMRNPRSGGDVPMFPAGEVHPQTQEDLTRKPSHLRDKDVHTYVRDQLEPKWGGELMSTDEELEDMPEETTNPAGAYPSKHRGNDEAVRRAMGY